MRRALKIALWALAGLIALPIVAVLALDIALNTGAGRNFAAHEIGVLTGGKVKVTGLSGHFPKYIAAKRIAIADRDGTYVTIDNAVLRWSPFALLHRAVDIDDLTASSIDVLREPVASISSKPSKPASSSGIPRGSLTLRHLHIGRLAIAKPVTGRPVALGITGHAVATSLSHIAVVLDATSLDGPGTYRLHASLDADRVTAKLSVHEPPGGPIAAFAGIDRQPELRDKPLDATLAIRGPRDHAALEFASALGDLKANGTGTLDLSPKTPGADITITIPELSPYASLGKQELGGQTVLHFVARHRDGTTDLHFEDTVEITKAAKPVPVLVGKRATLKGDFTITKNLTTIRAFTIDMAALKARIAGTVTPSEVAVHGTMEQPDLSRFDPKLSGHASEVFHLSGKPTDLALHGTADGVVTAKGIESGPFHLGIDVAHLPEAPSGSVTGSGSLYGAPLSLAANFVRKTNGALDLDLRQLVWKSLSGQGRLTRAPGATLPDGTLHLEMSRIADLAPLLNLDVAGALTADFAHRAGQPATLAVNAANLAQGKTASLRDAKIDATIDHITTDPVIDATATLTGIRAPSAAGTLNLTAKGTQAALAVTAAGDFTNLGGKPAKLTLAATVDGKTRTALVTKLDAAARGVTARLLAPATIETQPGIAVRNLTLALGGLGSSAHIAADGTITPSLDLKAKIDRLPAAIVGAVDPKLEATGLIDATAHLTGSLAAPTGTVTLDGKKLAVLTGRGAGLPPADITARETLLGHQMRGTVTASLGTARLALGGTAPLSMAGNMDLSVRLDNLSAGLAKAFDPKLAASGTISAKAKLTGTPRDPRGTIKLAAKSMHLLTGPAASLPPADLSANATLAGRSATGKVTASLGTARLSLAGTAPLSMTGKMDLAFRLDNLSASLAKAFDPKLDASGTISAKAKLTGTPREPHGTIELAAKRMRLLTGPAASLRPANLAANATLAGRSANADIRLTVGKLTDLTIKGTAPLSMTGTLDLALSGRTDLGLIDPITEARGTRLTGTLTPAFTIRGTPTQPQVNGRLTLTDASVRNISSGLDLSRIDMLVTAVGKTITLDHLTAHAGDGTITGKGTIGLGKPMPIDLHIALTHASPVSSDIVTEKLGGGISITGDVATGTKVAGKIDIEKADIQIPRGLPPSVAKLKIRKKGEPPPPPSSPPIPIGLDLTVDAHNQVFIRGNGLYANLGGSLHLGGTAAKPVPSGGFHLIRGYFSLGGKTLNLTKGTFGFNGAGLMPVIDLEMSGTASDGTVSTLALTGTPTAPKITLSSNPTLPSDQVLAHLLYGSSTENLSAFQAASLTASLAQLAGIGGGGPGVIGGVRKALGLDELSVGGGSSSPTVNAGRYVAPGIYVGAEQSATGAGTKAKVEINLSKGLKLKTEVQSGGGSSSGSGESVGLTYQFDY